MPAILEPLLRTLVIIVAVIGLVRLNGLRSFSKMSSFDFALTIATGSVIASTAMSVDQPIHVGAIAVAAIFAIQAVIAIARTRASWFQRAVDNTPLLLMRGPNMIEENLIAARMTRDDVMSKLREANVWEPDQVIAVVLETTGDVSVLHSGADRASADARYVLEGVRERP